MYIWTVCQSLEGYGRIFLNTLGREIDTPIGMTEKQADYIANKYNGRKIRFYVHSA